MAQYQYDKDGNYLGKTLSEKEHQQKKSAPLEYICYLCCEKTYFVDLIDIKSKLGENIYKELPIEWGTFSQFNVTHKKICKKCTLKFNDVQQIKEIVSKKRRKGNIEQFCGLLSLVFSTLITITLVNKRILWETPLYNFLFWIFLVFIFYFLFNKAATLYKR